MSAAAAIAKQDAEDVEEKCTICLCNFEEEEDVRYVVEFNKPNWYCKICIALWEI